MRVQLGDDLGRLVARDVVIEKREEVHQLQHTTRLSRHNAKSLFLKTLPSDISPLNYTYDMVCKIRKKCRYDKSISSTPNPLV